MFFTLEDGNADPFLQVQVRCAVIRTWRMLSINIWERKYRISQLSGGPDGCEKHPPRKNPVKLFSFFPFSILFQKGAKKYLHTCPLTSAKVIIYNVDDICVAFSASSLIVVVIWMETLLFMCKSNFDDAPPFQSGQLRHASAWSGATQRGKLIYILIW